MSDTYNVKLPVFEGPLDLLLHLIEERELEITKVSLTAVTDQYLHYMSQVEELRPDRLADFLIIAAKLLLIKSRTLLPQPPEQSDEEEEEDVGDELVRRLIEYRRFKSAAGELRFREEQGLRAYARLLAAPEPQPTFRLEGVTLDALLEAVRQAMMAQPTASVDEVVTPLTVSLPEKIAQLETLLAERRGFSFTGILKEAKSRTEIVVTFLALLQLMKRRKVVVEQQQLYGEILVSLPE